MRDITENNINRDLNYDEPITMDTVLSRERKAIPGRFEGKAAVVTGGTSGIGLSIVEELLKEGCKVGFTGRNEKTGQTAIDHLEGMGLSGFIFIQADMHKEEDCHKAVDKTYEAFGRIDYLVNNAFPFTNAARDFTTEEWMESFEGGLLAYARMMSFVSPYMIEVGGGAIVNVSTISGHIAQGSWIYNSMKGGVGMLSKSAAMDFARDNIRVNLMSPAHVWTRQTMRHFLKDGQSNEEARNFVKFNTKGYMLNRGGEPVECAAATLFLLSDDASYITGSEFMVDGGFIACGSQGSFDLIDVRKREYNIDPPIKPNFHEKG